MSLPQHNRVALMVPQILFQCHHCGITLQVPLSFAGRSGPCPHCGNSLQTPAPPLTHSAEEEQPIKRYANPASTYVTDAKLLTGRSLSRAEPTTRSLNRGIMADQAINHGQEMKKERRNDGRMMLWFLVVILLLAAATYWMKSLVAGG